MKNVLMEWMGDLSFKKQTVVLMMVRGPDCGMSRELKPLIRFIRAVAVANADPTKDFMRIIDFATIDEMEKENPAVIDGLSGHFIHHLNLALQVIGYDHPDKNIREKALEAYAGIDHKLAVSPMSEEQYRKRLRDNVGGLAVAK